MTEAEEQLANGRVTNSQLYKAILDVRDTIDTRTNFLQEEICQLGQRMSSCEARQMEHRQGHPSSDGGFSDPKKVGGIAGAVALIATGVSVLLDHFLSH